LTVREGTRIADGKQNLTHYQREAGRTDQSKSKRRGSTLAGEKFTFQQGANVASKKGDAIRGAVEKGKRSRGLPRLPIPALCRARRQPGEKQRTRLKRGRACPGRKVRNGEIKRAHYCEELSTGSDKEAGPVQIGRGIDVGLSASQPGEGEKGRR